MSLAWSITEVSNAAKYILVVLSELWPMPSLMTERGMPCFFAMVAQECRATYDDSGTGELTRRPSDLRFSLSTRSALLYCIYSERKGRS